jgi:hypothetical protein
MTDLTVEEYSEKALVVRGETTEHKEELKQLGGKYNARLRGGPGWIFSKKKEADVMEYISSGEMTTPDTKPTKSERTSERTPKKTSDDTRKQIRSLHKKVDALTKMVQQLLDAGTTVVESSGDEPSEEELPMKRLLK